MNNKQLLSSLIPEKKAEKILFHCENTFKNLIKLSHDELLYFGLTKNEADRVRCIFNIMEKVNNESAYKKRIFESKNVYEMLKHFEYADKEHFFVVFLNRRNFLIKFLNISIGGVTKTIVDSKILFKEALINRAVSVILVHNHPSGNTQPSPDDIELTKQIKSGCSLLEMSLVDHLIIGENGYYSFADEGML
jgi:DNA repair protein RadC